MKLHKIHKSWLSFGSATLCRMVAYSPEYITLNWKRVNCKRCLKLKESYKKNKYFRNNKDEY